MSFVATQRRQRLGHITKAAPQHAVTTHDDRTKANGTALRQFGKVFLLSIDNGQYLITTYPYLVTITILGFNSNVANRIQQLFGQTIHGIFPLSRICTFGLTMHILEPEVSMGSLTDFRHQWEIIDFRSLP